MLGALLYLRLTSLRNLLRVRLLRLRQPKYLVGAIVGGAYFWFFFLRRAILPATSGAGLPRGAAAELQALPLMFIAVPILLLGLKRVIEAWIAPDDKPGLAFTEAEVAFLFPAPLTRRMLVHFKLLGSQVTILISSLLLGLMAARWVALGGSYLQHVIGCWVIFSTLNLHVTGAAFTVKRLIDGGVSKAWRQVAVTGVILLFLAVAAVAAWCTAPPPTPADTASPLRFVQYATHLLDTGVLAWLVLPFKIVLHPLLAADGAEFLSALGPALLLLAAHYLWVVRAETTFEEASIALAEKRTALIAAMREGKYRLGRTQPKARRQPFRLAPAGGRPEVAFLWKNLLSTSAWLRPRTAFIAAGLIFVGCNALALQPQPQGPLLIVATIAMIMAGYIAFLGPQFCRQDLRSDLAHADILKSYPLQGWQVLLGELLTPVAILSTLLWLALLAVALTLQTPHAAWLTPGLRGVATAGIAAINPLLCAIQLLIPNAAAVLFPGWMHATRHRGERGIEMLGQRIIFVLGQLVVILLALLPAALGAAALIFATSWLVGPAVSVGLTAVAVAVILAAEIAAGLWWLGGRFERLDLAAELRP
jgi:ABC-2 type transport system permease protein